MSLIAKNLRHLRKLRSMSQELLASELDITRARLGAYEESRSEPSIGMLIKLAEFFKLPIDVMVKNDLTKSGDNGYIEIGRQRVLFPIVVNQRQQNQIELVSAQASAGYMNGFADPEYIESLPLIELPMLTHGKFRAFPIKGDSMLPVRSGSIVIGRHIEELFEIKDGKTYIVVTDRDGIVYKRVYNKAHEDGTIHLHSDNKIYEPYQIAPQEILEIWEFAANITLEENNTNEISLEQLMQKLDGMHEKLDALSEKN